MPTSPLRNLLYQLALPVLAPSPRGQMTHQPSGLPLTDPDSYESLLIRHHVLGSSLLLTDGTRSARVDTSVSEPQHTANADTLYRVASITKMATALVTLRLAAKGAFALDDLAADLLPDGHATPALRGITLRHLLSHTSGLCDIPAVDAGIRNRSDWHEVLTADGIISGQPGAQFRYCNFGFGLIGCILEHASSLALDALYEQELFRPLGMRATLSGATLSSAQIMPISRVLRYRKGQDVIITALGRQPLERPESLYHYGYAAGAMYTDVLSISRMLHLIANKGAFDNQQLLPEPLAAQMLQEHASYGVLSPGMRYGLGLILYDDPKLPGCRIFGHQGYAYGCADGAFWDATTGRQVIFLNGGCSEARVGRLGRCNRDLLRWALGKELPQWLK